MSDPQMNEKSVVLWYRKPVVWLLLVAALAVIVVAICLLTGLPQTGHSDPAGSDPATSEPTGTTTTASEEALRQEFPQYFDLPAEDGLTVYVWQMAADSYSCGLRSGRGQAFDDTWAPIPTTLEEMQVILRSYDIPADRITIYAIRNFLSSYAYTIDEAYTAGLRERFGLPEAAIAWDARGLNWTTTATPTTANPDTVKVNTAVIVAVQGDRVIVGRTEGGTIHCNDSRHSSAQWFAFQTDKAATFAVGDVVSIVHTGEFSDDDPPVGIALEITKTKE